MSQFKIITHEQKLDWDEVQTWSFEARKERREELYAEREIVNTAIEKYLEALPEKFKFEGVRFLAGWEAKAGISPNYTALVFPTRQTTSDNPEYVFFVALEQGLAYLSIWDTSIRGDLGMLKAADDEASGFDGD